MTAQYSSGFGGKLVAGLLLWLGSDRCCTRRLGHSWLALRGVCNYSVRGLEGGLLSSLLLLGSALSFFEAATGVFNS